MTSKGSIFLIALFSVLLGTAAISGMHTALASGDNLAGQQNLAQTTQQGGGGQQNGDDDEPEEEDDPIPTEPDGGTGGTPGTGGFPAVPSGRNLAESNQVGGIGSGNIQQNAQGAVNEQYCSTVAGIGDRRCAQYANPEGQNIQDCDAVAGLGQAACVQSEAGGGTGTCLTANGRPYICYTDTGTAVSGSGQASAGGP